jgi:hypothetical protein
MRGVAGIMGDYTVYRADGTQVLPGEGLVNHRGERDIFHAVTHPRKVCVRIPSDDWYARDGYTVQEYYPSVYRVEIRAVRDGGTYVWNPVSELGKALPINMEG